MDEIHAHSVSEPGDGYLAALGYLQIGTGSLTLVMSLMAFSQWLLGNAELLDPTKVFGLANGFIDRAIAAYVSLQLSLGWAAGALQLAAGICCLRGRRPRLVWMASFVSLANFPHGTMAAILMLHALCHGEISLAFQAGRPRGPGR
jgi:hypothetical protein